MTGASMNGRPVDHEGVLGSGADLPLALAAFRSNGELSRALAERVRVCGCDPEQRQLVDHDGAEAMLQRILHPDGTYFSPALLLVSDVTALRVASTRTRTPLDFSGVGHVALFRLENGEVGIESIQTSMVEFRTSEHLGANVAAEVWSEELQFRCTGAQGSLLEVTLARKPSGLFAYNHRAEG
jgi:hypothetical protein